MQRSCETLPYAGFEPRSHAALGKGPARTPELWVVLLDVNLSTKADGGPAAKAVSPFLSSCEAPLTLPVPLTCLDTVYFNIYEIQKVEVIVFVSGYCKSKCAVIKRIGIKCFVPGTEGNMKKVSCTWNIKE